MKISHQLAPSEISSGSLFLSRTDRMEKYFREFKDGFDIESKWGNLYSRTVGTQYIWMGYEYMRNFNPFDILEFEETKKGVVKLTKRIQGMSRSLPEHVS